MPETIEAVFEHGVLRPLRPLALADHSLVQISICPAPKQGPTLKEIQQMTFDMGSRGRYPREEIYEDRC